MRVYGDDSRHRRRDHTDLDTRLRRLIAAVHPDGGAVQRLTARGGRHRFPSWSAEGEWLSYTNVDPDASDGITADEVYVLRAGDTQARRIVWNGAAFSRFVPPSR